MEEEIENLVEMRKGGRNSVFGKYEKNGEVELVRSKSLSNPPFHNAFEFISSGSDLSTLLESKQKSGSMFTSKFAGKLWRKGKVAEVYEVEMSKWAVEYRKLCDGCSQRHSLELARCCCC